METLPSKLKVSAIGGFATVLPFAVLEFTFNTVTAADMWDVVPLFGFLWLLSFAFILILIPIAQAILAGRSVGAHPVSLLIRVSSAVLLLTVWIYGVTDQMQCFLGIPNCD